MNRAPTIMVGGFVHGFAYSLLLTLLLRQICKKTGYRGRADFVALAGAAGSRRARTPAPVCSPRPSNVTGRAIVRCGPPFI